MPFGDMLTQFGQDIGGLLDPEAANYLGNLPANPLFGAGMGILSANVDPNQNVFQGAMAGLQSARQTQQEQEDRERMEELRRRLAEMFQQQPGGQSVFQPSLDSIYPPQTGLGTPMQSPVLQPNSFDQIMREYAYGGQNYG